MRMPRPIVRIVRKLAGLPGPGDNFWYEPIGAASATGIQVTATSALAFPAVFACVRVLAETIASLPLIVYRRLPNGEKQRAENHPIFDLLHNRPNRKHGGCLRPIFPDRRAQQLSLVIDYL